MTIPPSQLSDLEDTIKRIQTHKVGGIDEKINLYATLLLCLVQGHDQEISSGSDRNHDHQQRRNRGADHDGHDDDQRLFGGALSALGCGTIGNQGGGKIILRVEIRAYRTFADL